MGTTDNFRGTKFYFALFRHFSAWNFDEKLDFFSTLFF